MNHLPKVFGAIFTGTALYDLKRSQDIDKNITLPKIQKNIDDILKQNQEYELLGYHGSRQNIEQFDLKTEQKLFIANKPESSLNYLYGGTGTLNLVFAKKDKMDSILIEKNNIDHNYVFPTTESITSLAVKTIPVNGPERHLVRHPLNVVFHQLGNYGNDCPDSMKGWT